MGDLRQALLSIQRRLDDIANEIDVVLNGGEVAPSEEPSPTQAVAQEDERDEDYDEDDPDRTPARRQGYDAHQAGVALKACPHPKGSFYADEWQEGWFLAD